MRALERSGVAVTAQDVPSARAGTLDDVLRGARPSGDARESVTIALLGAIIGLDVVSFPRR